MHFIALRGSIALISGETTRSDLIFRSFEGNGGGSIEGGLRIVRVETEEIRGVFTVVHMKYLESLSKAVLVEVQGQLEGLQQNLVLPR